MSDVLRWPLAWLDAPGAGVLFCSATIARNVRGFPFPHRASKRDHEELANLLGGVLQQSDLIRGGLLLPMNQLGPLQCGLLRERRLASREFPALPGRLLGVDGRGVLSFMVGEEDHLRVQAMLPGVSCVEVLEETKSAERRLARELDFAFDEEWGFLSASPGNAGTGLRISLLLHLPALEIAGGMPDAASACEKQGVLLRDPWGDAPRPEAGFVLLSNLFTLGVQEEETADLLRRVSNELLQREGRAREHLLQEKRDVLEDLVWRAFGMVRFERLCALREALAHLSLLRLGGDLGLLPPIDAEWWKRLVLSVHPAHLQVEAERRGFEGSDKALRAMFLRQEAAHLD